MSNSAPNLNNYLGTLTTGQQAEISFFSNANPDLTPANPSYNASTYSYGQAIITTAQAQLQTGCTITYNFNGSSLTLVQQADVEQAMAVWSGECNVKFVYDNASNALLNFTTTSAGESTSIGVQSTNVASVYQITSATVNINLSGAYGLPGDYNSTTGGYGQGSILHELGHVLGLGHAGPYNDSANPSSQQYSAYDSRAWSVMSYINPNDTSAKYYSSSPIPNANYTYTYTSGLTTYSTQTVATTPMGLDIYAVQRLYGGPTSTMFAGGQIFGFHSNIGYISPAGTLASVDMYNFAVDTNPIVTLYDYGSNNTLDLSGFTSNDHINLNAGAFSSTGNYTDNIFIEYGTAIDNFVAGSGNDTITANSQADRIFGGSGIDTVVFSGTELSYNLSRSGSLVDVSANGITDSLSSISYLQFSNALIATSSIPNSGLTCFAAGSLIETPWAQTPVEALQVGDIISTMAGPERIIWTGSRSIDLERIANPEAAYLVRIRAHALAWNIPAQDLLITEEHCLFIDGGLVPARMLVNGRSILRDTSIRRYSYHHVELAAHAIIKANGVLTETYLDTGNRAGFETSDCGLAPPDPKSWAEHAAAPLMTQREKVQPIWERLNNAAIERGLLPAFGWRKPTLTQDHGLHLQTEEGELIAPAEIAGNRFLFNLPPEARRLRLRSRTARRDETVGPFIDDRRRLGVLVGDIGFVEDGQDFKPWNPHHEASPMPGWHEPQWWGDRWTDGDAHLPLAAPPPANARLSVTIIDGGPYLEAVSY
ncbi:MAG: Hint domain-containing protein [Acidocella sp.]|nr:Hint domain-containing protein [Acidocella sp.]